MLPHGWVIQLQVNITWNLCCVSRSLTEGLGANVGWEWYHPTTACPVDLIASLASVWDTATANKCLYFIPTSSKCLPVFLWYSIHQSEMLASQYTIIIITGQPEHWWAVFTKGDCSFGKVSHFNVKVYADKFGACSFVPFSCRDWDTTS